MSEKELSECRRTVVQLHKDWKSAVATGDQERAKSLDKRCRDLRTRIVTYNRDIRKVQ